MESKCVFTFIQVPSFTLMHRVCWSLLFRQIVGADAASSADRASSLAKGVSVSVSRLKIMTTESSNLGCRSKNIKQDQRMTQYHGAQFRPSRLRNSFWQVFKRV